MPRKPPRPAVYLTRRPTLVERLLGRNRFQRSDVPGPEVEGFELVRDGASHVAWWSSRLAPWTPFMSVGAIIPEGFEAYGRLLHPVSSREEGRVPWSRVSAWSGRPLEPTSFFGDLARRTDGVSWRTVGDGPDEGEFPEAQCRRLAAVLGEFTSTPEDCWFAMWFGWSTFSSPHHDESVLIDLSPAIKASGRRYLLYRGPLRSITRFRLLGGRFRPPSFWWPQDRRWFVSTEIDAGSTYIGGQAKLIERLRSIEDLELLPSDIAHPFDGTHPGQISWYSAS